ncbi:porin [Caballeronia mineralivorans PML1(12)]|uniref:Porin n=1 Tax=Caballeronia mineralivorans PML1(12) TaxID=908627 RepID=A0A0J1CMF9_9BURK|nr:porin [Caballeronia mineralivorans]KLU21907.1 porin [Caballeronia mineralivorans PML1(12)]
MKKSIMAVAALSMFTGIAHAQSSVTLYGIVDEGLTYNSNAGGSRLYNLVSGGLQNSRWGLRGTEDLGGGVTASFRLENGFNLSNGALSQANSGSTQGLMFGRQAWVGLGNRFGTLTIGRQYDSVVDYLGPLEVGDQWGGSVTAHPGDVDNFNNTGRVNNSIKFASTSYQGFSFSGLYSLGGIAGNFSSNQIWSLGGGYAKGPLTAAVGYLNVRSPNLSLYGNNGASTPATAAGNFFTSPVSSGFASAHTMQVIGAGGAYTFGIATIGATYSNTKFLSLGNVSSGPNTLKYSGSATFNDVEVNAKFQVTPALVLGAAMNYMKGDAVSSSSTLNNGAKYLQGSVGADYFLSQRTDLYFIGTYQKASGTKSTGGDAVAAITGLTPSTSNRQGLLRVGIRHKF